MDGVAVLRHKCTCERNGKGQVTKRNDACPVRHRGTAVSSLVPAKRVDMSRVQMAVLIARDELMLIRATVPPNIHVAGIAKELEIIRRYLDGE